MQSLIRCSDIIKLWVAKTKGGWIKKKRPVGKWVYFANLSLSRNKGKPWKESLTGNFRLTFSLYARLVVPVMFLLKAFTITSLFDSNTEQGTDGLCFLMEPVLQWSNHRIVKLVSAIFYQVFIFHQMIALQKLWKMFFRWKISSNS